MKPIDANEFFTRSCAALGLALFAFMVYSLIKAMLK